MPTKTVTACLWVRAKQIALITSLLILQACGGGGGGGGVDTTADATAHLYDSFGRDVYGTGGFDRSDSGVDGSGGDGAPIAFADVVISGLTGTPVTAKTDAQGYYRAKITGLTAPLLVTITKPDGTGLRYSLSMAAIQPGKFVTINISGLTTQIASDVAVALGKTGAADLTPTLLNSNPALVTTTVAASIATQTTQLATAMAAAGVSASTYNPISTPFVADHTGYDNLLDNTVVTVPPTGPTLTPTILAAFNPIIGAWSLNTLGLATTITFMEDGHYMMSNGQVGANAVFLQVWPGLEYGTYSYNSSTGDLSVACASVDTNGTAGFTNSYSGGFDDSGVPIGTCTITPRSAAINGNVMTLTNLSNSNQNTFTRIADSTNPLVGSWAGTGSDKPMLTLTADNHYMLALAFPTKSVSPDQVWPGIEYGTFSWNATTGTFSVGCALVDTNGTYGFSNFSATDYRPFTDGLISSGHTPVGTVGGGQPVGPCPAATRDLKLTVAGNVMTLVAPSGTYTLNRVVYGNTASATPSAFKMSIKTRIDRVQDFFPGNRSSFSNGVTINIDSVNAGGASPSTYDSVRITGNGLPTTGLWYVRSAISSTFALTTVRSATPQTTATLAQAMLCPDCVTYRMSRTKAVTGANASVLDTNPTSGGATSTDGSYDGTNGVKPIKGTVYTFEIFNNATLVATETRTLSSDLVPADQAVNLPWNDPGPNTLAAMDITNTALNGIQNSMLVDWIQKPGAELIQYLWVSETNGAGDNATPFVPGVTSVIATPLATAAGSTQFTGMTGTTSYNVAPYGGYREIGMSYQMLDGSSKSAAYVYYP
jgi:hypothetical protein